LSTNANSSSNRSHYLFSLHTQVPLEDLEKASRLLIQALELRERYMGLSSQSFPQTASRFLKSAQNKNFELFHHHEHEDKKTIAGKYLFEPKVFHLKHYLPFLIDDIFH
jgi:hypothetical protein